MKGGGKSGQTSRPPAGRGEADMDFECERGKKLKTRRSRETTRSHFEYRSKVESHRPLDEVFIDSARMQYEYKGAKGMVKNDIERIQRAIGASVTGKYDMCNEKAVEV